MPPPYVHPHAQCIVGASHCVATCTITTTLEKLGIDYNPQTGSPHLVLESILAEYLPKQRDGFWKKVFELRNDEDVYGFIECIRPVSSI
jgi:hypothetical protein